MKEYEAILEIINQCPLNRDRDTFFEEIETDDLDAFVKKILKQKFLEKQHSLIEIELMV